MAFRGSVHLRVRKDVSLTHLTQLIDAIGKAAGCSPCGLLGVDLRLSGDPAESLKLPQIDGVQTVSIEA
jgi:hypothetical protein